MKKLKTVLLILAFNIVGLVQAQNKIALVVGIGEYPKTSGWSTIHGDNDILLVTEMLHENGFGKDNIVILKNEAATKSAIIEAMKHLCQMANKDDVVYFHFSGHGQPYEDVEPFDEADGWDESIIPYDAMENYRDGEYEGENHIIDDELYQYLFTLRNAVGQNGFVIVAIDACHAGGSSRSVVDDDFGLYSRGTNVGFSPNGKNYHPRISANSNYPIDVDDKLSHIIIMEACRSYQTNYEIRQDGQYYGPLSYYVSYYFKSHNIEPKLQHVIDIKAMMDSDSRLIRQNMVYETSLK